MAYKWASLLDEVASYSARREESLLDDDEERRRGRASGPAVTSDRAEKQYLPTGIAARAATITVPSGEQTIASILQPARSSQQDVIALVGAFASRKGPEDDDLHEALNAAFGFRQHPLYIDNVERRKLRSGCR